MRRIERTLPRITLLALAASWCLSPLTTSAQPCQPFWLLPQSPPNDPAHYGGWKVVFDDGTGPALYSDYSYTFMGSRGGFARWNGHTWQRLDQGLPALNYGTYLYVLDDGAGARLYGTAERVDGTGLGMWIWNGQSWQATPPGFFSGTAPNGAMPQCSFDDGAGTAIYGICQIGFDFYIARWDGQMWAPFTLTSVLETAQMLSLDLGGGPAIYFSGFYQMPSIPAAHQIAKWDGHQWTPLGEGFTGTSADTKGMVVYDDGSGPELYIGGGFNGVAHVPDTTGLAKWNGKRWAAVPGFSPAGVRGLCVYDDGIGPGLYVTGDFIAQGGVACSHIARYDRTGWHALGAGVSPNSAQMAAFPQDPRGPSLFVWTSSNGNVGGGMRGGGDFQWVGCPNCYANCDLSTQPPVLNVLDFLCFLNKFAARDPYANCTVDSTIDINDFLCFLNKFAAGCP